MLKILLPDSSRDTDYLSQMHQLRYKRFVVQHGWHDGLQSINQMEFDTFDHSDPLYLVNVGDNDRVNAMVRLIQTSQPNYTLNCFAENAKMMDIERGPDIMEISCACTDRKQAPPDALMRLIVGLMELGLACNVQHYIATVSHLLQSTSNKLHWKSDELSPRVDFGGQSSVVLKYPLNDDIYRDFRVASGVSETLLHPEEIERCQLKQRILGM